MADWEGKDTEDAVGVINWVANSLQTELGRIYRIIPDSYARGRVDTLSHRQMEFHVAGELTNILRPLVDRVLTAAYESRDIQFEPPFVFRKEEGVKVINGIVRTGKSPKERSQTRTSALRRTSGLASGSSRRRLSEGSTSRTTGSCRNSGSSLTASWPMTARS